MYHGASDTSWRGQPMMVGSEQPVTASSVQSLPDLDELAIVHTLQEKRLRAEGNLCYWFWYFFILGIIWVTRNHINNDEQLFFS